MQNLDFALVLCSFVAAGAYLIGVGGRLPTIVGSACLLFAAALLILIASWESHK